VKRQAVRFFIFFQPQSGNFVSVSTDGVAGQPVEQFENRSIVGSLLAIAVSFSGKGKTMNSYFIEAIAQAKHQEYIEEARVERIVKDIRSAKPSVGIKFIRPIRQIACQVGRAIVEVGAKLQEKQGPIL